MLLLVTAALTGCGGDGKGRIELGTVERRSVAEVVQAPGSVVAKASVTLRAPAAGKVDTLRVASDDRVAAGDVLLTVESPAAQDALQRAETAAANLDNAGSLDLPASGQAADSEGSRAARQAFDDAEAAAGELPEGPVRDAVLAQVAGARASFFAAERQAQAVIDQFTAGLASLGNALGSLSEAQSAQADAAVAAARRAVEALTVRAPVSGIVTLGSGTGSGAGADASALLGALPPEAAGQAGALLGGGSGTSSGSGGGGPIVVGSPVEAGATLATVIDASELSMRADVDETDVLSVDEGQRADVEFDAVPGAVYSATVRSIDLAPTSSARGGVSYSVALSLGEGKEADGDTAPTPRPGMSAVVSLKVAEVADAVTAPASALVRDGTRDTVWLVQEGKAVRREVRLGAQGDSHVEISEGLAAGDQIVTRGADRVREGDELP